MPGARFDFTIPLAVIGIGAAVSLPRILDWSAGRPVSASSWVIAAVGIAAAVASAGMLFTHWIRSRRN